eukprot:gene5816-233_t
MSYSGATPGKMLNVCAYAEGGDDIMMQCCACHPNKFVQTQHR